MYMYGVRSKYSVRQVRTYLIRSNLGPCEVSSGGLLRMCNPRRLRIRTSAADLATCLTDLGGSLAVLSMLFRVADAQAAVQLRSFAAVP